MSLPSTFTLPKYSTSWQEEYRLARPRYQCGIKPLPPRNPGANAMTKMNFPLTAADRMHEPTVARSLLRERLAGKPQHGSWDSGFGYRPNPSNPNSRFRSALFRRDAPKGNRRTIFPVRRGAAFVPIEFAQRAKLRHHVRAFLILPMMRAGAGQRLLLLRQDGVIYVHI